ncbi:MAG: RNA polymerase sigma factor region1.1 domain-containing protein [Candidatus Omnitrophica bacterium]|nr:RNA polymerase sigma factor region1.1 domain-containing protein [Candidatus Omnitrophota bacterium]
MNKEKNKNIKGLIEKGKRQKRLSYDEINEILPENLYAPEEIEEIFSQLSDLQITIEDEDSGTFILHEEEVEEERLALEEVRNPLRSYLKKRCVTLCVLI